jgi:hypothetical protein
MFHRDEKSNFESEEDLSGPAEEQLALSDFLGKDLKWGSVIPE